MCVLIGVERVLKYFSQVKVLYLKFKSTQVKNKAKSKRYLCTLLKRRCVYGTEGGGVVCTV